MRFVCESCRAQYMINDEKVGPKGVKVRCRKCGYVILVKRPDAAAAKSAAPPAAPAAMSNDPDDATATQVMQNPLDDAADTSADTTNPGSNGKSKAAPGDSFLGADEDEIGAVFDQVLKTGPQSLPKEGDGGQPPLEEDRQSTRVLDAEMVRKLAAESGTEEPKADDGDALVADVDVPETDWYVAINEKQTGPVTLQALKEHWDKGEVSGDSLCWRAGYDDWIPLSEVQALASVLAPKPPRPIVVAPQGMPGPSVVSVPVHSAFASGGVQQSVQSEMQVPMGASASGPEAEDPGGWRPSAASALASLVKDEMAALSRPPPKAASPAAPAPSGGGLLDLPPPDEKPSNGAHAGASVDHHQHQERPRPAVSQATINPYMSNTGATFSAPAVTQYRPQSNRTLILIVAAVGAVLVMGLFGLVIWLATRTPAVVQAPPVVPPPVVAVTPPTPAPTPTVAAPTRTPEEPKPVAVADTRPAPRVDRKPPRTSPRPTRDTPKDDPPARPASKPSSDTEDDFAKAFGVSDSPSKPKKADPPSSGRKPSVYIPPPPGGGGDVKETLGQSDIMEVVLANRSQLVRCVAEQRKRDPGVSGSLVMRWVVKTDGRPTKVSVASDEFKSTYMAGCVGGLIKGWRFPRSKKQGDPVNFPFKF